MTPEQIGELKADYLEWSGGIPPSNFLDIERYLEYAIDVNLPLDEAQVVLESWAGIK